MTSILPMQRPSSYRLTGALADDSFAGPVRLPPPDEADREDLVVQKLGMKGWGRLHHFRYYYDAGWGNGTGKAVSPRALEAFFRFLERAQFRTKPSLFLTDRGGLELCWEDPFGKGLQVEFFSDGIEYYCERDEREEVLPHSKWTTVAAEVGVS